MIVYLFNEVTKSFIGSYECQESPLEEGVFIIPTHSTTIQPTSFTESQTCTWEGSNWLVLDKPVDVVDPVPAVEQLIPSLSPAQIRLVLNQFGLLDTVEAAIKAGDKSLQIEWEFRSEFTRDNEVLKAMATTLNITDSQLDEMFTIGATL